MSGSSVGPTTIATDESEWWERERLLFLREVLDGSIASHLDVGCGRGDIAGAIGESDCLVVAVDAFRYPEWDSFRDRVEFVVAAAGHLPFKDLAFSRTSAFDVIEHLAEDQPALEEAARVTDRDGDVVITVPAHPRLWSAHDERVGHFRRYTANSLSAAGRRVGLTPARTTYFFSWLTPIAFATRRARGRLSGSEGGTVVATVARGLCRTERWVLRRWRIGFGTSLLMILCKGQPSRQSSSS